MYVGHSVDSEGSCASRQKRLRRQNLSPWVIIKLRQVERASSQAHVVTAISELYDGESGTGFRVDGG